MRVGGGGGYQLPDLRLRCWPLDIGQHPGDRGNSMKRHFALTTVVELPAFTAATWVCGGATDVRAGV